MYTLIIPLLVAKTDPMKIRAITPLCKLRRLLRRLFMMLNGSTRTTHRLVPAA